ncbi:MAG: rhomboid family intramembrane serine protease [Spirochaetae bacterium HGW-Spirochaetae-1]|jgi:rhomboid protease GluP|nr:MAG: rhomboid family intramembrane serine protease [Spirochaetae bacterium HGW-Spirochaetae-1]
MDDGIHDIDFDDDETSVQEKKKGPLSRPPRWRDIHPALQIFLLFVVSTLMYRGYSFGSLFPASGEAVFSGHQYWRILTSLFTHSGMTHLLSNSWLFIIFGWFLRTYFGTIVFPVLSLVLGMAGTWITLLFYDPTVNLVGASGMIHSMIGLWIVLYVRFDSDHTVPMRLFRAVGFSLAMLIPSTVQAEVSYTAHGVGFILGIAGGLLCSPFVKTGMSPEADEGDINDRSETN